MVLSLIFHIYIALVQRQFAESDLHGANHPLDHFKTALHPSLLSCSTTEQIRIAHQDIHFVYNFVNLLVHVFSDELALLYLIQPDLLILKLALNERDINMEN